MSPGIIEQQMQEWPREGTYQGDIRGRGGVEQNRPQSEEEQLDQFLQASSRIVQQNREPLKKAIQTGGLARASSLVFDRVDNRFQGLSDMVRFFGGIGVLTQIAEAAEKDGVKKLSEEERMKALATVLADKIEEGIESGKYDPNEMLQAAEQAKAMLAASGKAEEPANPQGGA